MNAEDRSHWERVYAMMAETEVGLPCGRRRLLRVSFPNPAKPTHSSSPPGQGDISIVHRRGISILR